MEKRAGYDSREIWLAIGVMITGLNSGKYRLEGWLTDQRESLTAEPVEIEIK